MEKWKARGKRAKKNMDDRNTRVDWDEPTMDVPNCTEKNDMTTHDS